MTQPRFRRAQPRLIFMHCLYLAKLNPVLRIGATVQMVERRSDDLEIAEQCWFESALCLFFSSNNVSLFAYVFTNGDPLLEWMKRNESNRVYWCQRGFLSLVYM